MKRKLDDVVDITHQKISLKNSSKKFRIVALSDLHPWTLPFPVMELIQVVNEEKPDVLVLGGDIVDKHVTEQYVDIFRHIETNDAKLAVLGNLEYNNRLDAGVLRSEYQRAGVKLLVNEIVKVDEVTIIGLDDYVYGYPDFNILKKI